MEHHNLIDAPLAGSEPRAYGDALLERSAKLARDGEEIVVTGNALARDVAEDPQRFSSGVSRFLQLPNGLDGEEHTKVRSLIDAYLAPDQVDHLEPEFRRIARELAADAAARGTVDSVNDLGAQYAVRAMTTWLGWPAELDDTLVAWVADNNAATRSGELARTAEVAERFDAIIRSVVEPLQEHPDDSVTSRLVHDDSLGRRLEFDEVVSVLRNWTAGDLSSMAYCIGVVLDALIEHPELQDRLRQGVSRREFGAIADEILRADSPFVSNRRVTTCPVQLDGVDLPGASGCASTGPRRTATQMRSPTPTASTRTPTRAATSSGAPGRTPARGGRCRSSSCRRSPRNSSPSPSSPAPGRASARPTRSAAGRPCRCASPLAGEASAVP